MALKVACVFAGHSEGIHRGLLKMWLAIEIEDFPAWFEWQQSCFELIQRELLPLGASITWLFGCWLFDPGVHDRACV